MPFMKGGADALRRTFKYLEEGTILLREDVKVMTFGFIPGKRSPHHDGLE